MFRLDGITLPPPQEPIVLRKKRGTSTAAFNKRPNKSTKSYQRKIEQKQYRNNEGRNGA